jgi:hypothetical protein
LIIALAASAALLGGCTAAPRAPAATLAEAGIKATGSFSAEVRAMESDLAGAAVGDAFVATLRRCLNPNPGVTCEEVHESDETREERRQLAKAVGLRAKALDALGGAYAALQTEAAYDQGADLSAAAGDAVEAANEFAAAAAKLGGASTPPVVPERIASLVDFGFGLLGERLQRKRLLAASRQIAQATLQIRNGMIHEAGSFARLSKFIVGERTQARMTLMKAGFLSTDHVMKQVAQQMNLSLTVPGTVDQADYQMALQASLRELSRQEVIAAQERYQAGIAALGALLQSHADLEKGRPLSLANIERLLARLDAAVKVPAPDPGPAPGAAPNP